MGGSGADAKRREIRGSVGRSQVAGSAHPAPVLGANQARGCCHGWSFENLHSGNTPARWRGMAPGSPKDLGSFSLHSPHATTVVLCESAIDAISCFALHPDRFCISTAKPALAPLTHPSWP